VGKNPSKSIRLGIQKEGRRIIGQKGKPGSASEKTAPPSRGAKNEASQPPSSLVLAWKGANNLPGNKGTRPPGLFGVKYGTRKAAEGRISHEYCRSRSK